MAVDEVGLAARNKMPSICPVAEMCHTCHGRIIGTNGMIGPHPDRLIRRILARPRELSRQVDAYGVNPGLACSGGMIGATVSHTDRSQVTRQPGLPARRAGIVAREGLFERLADAGRVTIVSAPAGSGKTLLLRSWISEAGLSDSTAWVSLGRRKPGPEHFWISVLDSLRTTVAGSAVMRELTAAPGLDGEAIVERLLEDLGSLEDPLWLVIDDAHELGPDDALRELALLAMRAPATLRLVLLARRDLRLGLHRLRLEGDLTEIRADELGFSLEEARALFEAAGMPLPDSALALLHARTEGWAAGLRLAALSLAGRDDPEQFAAEFSGSQRTVAEYLVDEVLDRLPHDVRQLLLRTSVLDRVNGPLADLLTGSSHSERVLQELESANAFVVSIDAQRSWFRCHRLFADLLQLGLRQTAPAEVAVLHHRAAGWLAEHGYPVEAVGHAQAAEEWTVAARLLSDHWLGLWLDGRSITAHELLAQFPPRVVAGDAELTALTAADELERGSLDQAARQLALASRLSQAVPEDRLGRVQTMLVGLRLQLARQRGDLAAVLEESHRLLAPAESPDVGRRGLDEELRALWLLNLGNAELWAARHEESGRHLEQALALARRKGRPFIAVGCLASRALLLSFSSFSAALQAGTEAVELAEEHGWSEEPIIGVAYAVLGAVGVWQGRLEQGQGLLDRAQRALTAELEPAEGSLLHRSRGLLELAHGRDHEALAALRAAVRLDALIATPHALAAQTQALMLQAMLRLGQTDRVERALAGTNGELQENPERRKVIALLALARDDPEAAAAALGPVTDGSLGVVHPVRLVEVLLLEAVARDALGDASGCGRALEQALELAESDGLVLPFLLNPAPELLERHRRQRTAHASLVSEIMSLLAGQPLKSPAGDLQALSEPLSESEVRVLRYLPTNLSAPDIAGELYLGVSTVKTHIHHVYQKLGVHRRAEAVERARSLGLLARASLTRR
jgi:LuxR family maltose regulon positive regulatory protein